MAATTTLLGLVTPTQGTLTGTWGDTVNYGISDYVDIAVAGTLTLTGDGAVTLANTTGSSSGNSITSTLAGAGTVTAQFSAVRVSGTTTTKVVTGPSYSKTYLVDNASSYAVTFKASGQTGVSISPGEKVYVYYNATDYVKVGGGGITYGAVKTTTYTAVANDGVQTSTSGGAFTVNLPASPATGTQVFIVDSAGTWGTNNLTIGRNGSTIAGSATDLVCDINSVSIQCIYDGTTWDIFAQIGANNTAVVTLTGTQTLTNKTLTSPTITSPTITGTGTIAAATVTLSSTLAVTGVATLSSDALVNGLTVGRGAGAVATNTAVGASALAANTSGGRNVAVGINSLNANTTGSQNSALGDYSMLLNTTGAYNSAMGDYAMEKNTTGGNNSAFGAGALNSNTTASNNTAVGYQAGYNNTTGAGNVYIGQTAGFANTTSNYNTFVGIASGQNTTGGGNTFVGTVGSSGAYGCGYLVTTGANNTIIGGFTGNQGGLDIRTASNYIVLSDGGGNPRLISNGSGEWAMGENPIAGYRLVVRTGDSTASTYATLMRNSSSTNLLAVRADGYFSTGTAANSPYNATTGSAANVYVDSGGQLSRSTSSLKYKTDVQDATHGLAEVLALRPVTYKGKRDGDTIFGGLIAEEVHAAGLTEFVQYADDGSPDALAYGNMVSLCIKAIQELKAEFDAYKSTHP